jgi:hypothetical protein
VTRASTTDPARDLDAERVGRLLSVARPGVAVTAVTPADETQGSASRLRLDVEYAPGRDAGLPRRMFLKRNLETFAFPAEMYSTEVRFYRDLLPELAIEHPDVYAIDHAEGTTEFSILMEDLAQRPGARLGIATLAVDVADVAGLLTTLARLHAAYWDSPRLDHELAWLDRPDDSVTVRFWQEIGPRLVRRHLESGHRAEIVDPTAWPQDRMWAAFARLQEVNASGPRTALHGDVHAGNVYYLDGAPGGLLDWQLMLQGSWALDVGYLLQTALDPDVRAAHERDLLAGYLDDLGRLGVTPPTFDDAWTRYRQQPIWGVIMWLITPNGVHTDEVQELSLARSLRAGDHLDTLAALGV